MGRRMCKSANTVKIFGLGYNVERKIRQIVYNEICNPFYLLHHLTDMMLQNTAMEFPARLEHYWQYRKESRNAQLDFQERYYFFRVGQYACILESEPNVL